MSPPLDSDADLVGVFQTAFAKIEVIYAAIEAGAERVLAKPVDSRELLPLVERLEEELAAVESGVGALGIGTGGVPAPGRNPR